MGAIFQFGGQTPLKLLHRLHRSGVAVLGTGVDAVDTAEDRERCSRLLDSLGIRQAACAFATDAADAVLAARKLGYPILLRPPYVLGGMAMELVYTEEELLASVENALALSDGRPLMLDRFIEDAIEVDVDAVCDGTRVAIAGVLEHIEEAGIHSGDSSCVIPPISLDDDIVASIEESTRTIARALGVVGMINIQYAVKDEAIYCLEINPRASRTVPFTSKATGIPWVKVSAQAIMGRPIPEELLRRRDAGFYAVKTPVLPFDRFPEVDSLLGPEMHATGEVMGLGQSFSEAFIKAQIAAGCRVPAGGHVFISVSNRHKWKAVFPAKALHELGYLLVATSGTAKVLRSHGVPVRVASKLSEGSSEIVALIEDGTIGLVVNTPVGKKAVEDGRAIRLAANRMKVPCITTMAGFHALVFGLGALGQGILGVASLQEFTAPIALAGAGNAQPVIT